MSGTINLSDSATMTANSGNIIVESSTAGGVNGQVQWNDNGTLSGLTGVYTSGSTIGLFDNIQLELGTSGIGILQYDGAQVRLQSSTDMNIQSTNDMTITNLFGGLTITTETGLIINNSNDTLITSSNLNVTASGLTSTGFVRGSVAGQLLNSVYNTSLGSGNIQYGPGDSTANIANFNYTTVSTSSKLKITLTFPNRTGRVTQGLTEVQIELLVDGTPAYDHTIDLSADEQSFVPNVYTGIYDNTTISTKTILARISLTETIGTTTNFIILDRDYASITVEEIVD